MEDGQLAKRRRVEEEKQTEQEQEEQEQSKEDNGVTTDPQANEGEDDDDEEFEPAVLESNEITGPNEPPINPADIPDSIKRRDEAEARREQSLPEFLELMEDYRPVIPDSVTNYYLEKAGFVSDDVRVKRLIALAAQKFVADIAKDAMQYCKSRMQNVPTQTAKERKSSSKPDRRLVLTTEDLSAALGEYGINATKPDYYV